MGTVMTVPTANCLGVKRCAGLKALLPALKKLRDLRVLDLGREFLHAQSMVVDLLLGSPRLTHLTEQTTTSLDLQELWLWRRLWPR